MATAKDIQVRPISAKDAALVVKRHHYSRSVYQASQLHFGVFLNGRCEGAMSFGQSIDKRKMIGVVAGTAWNGFIELNRMAFSEILPRNSESRALGVALRTIKKNYPHIDWVISFADGTQCGDGTIYRASGFKLIGVKKNNTLLRMPDGSIKSDITLNTTPGQSAGQWKKKGAALLAGFQLRYIYFLNPKSIDRLSVPMLPFSEIEALGAKMYRGIKSAANIDVDVPEHHSGEGGSIPTAALQKR